MKKLLICLSFSLIYHANINCSQYQPSQFPFTAFYWMKTNIGGVDVRGVWSKLDCRKWRQQRQIQATSIQRSNTQSNNAQLNQHQPQKPSTASADQATATLGQEHQGNSQRPLQTYLRSVQQQVTPLVDNSGIKGATSATDNSGQQSGSSAELKRSLETGRPVAPTGNLLAQAPQVAKSPELQKCEANIQLLEEISGAAADTTTPLETRRQKMAANNEKLDLKENCEFCVSTKGILRSNFRDPKDPIFTYLSQAFQISSLLATASPQERQQQLTGWTLGQKGRALMVASQVNNALAAQRQKREQLLAEQNKISASQPAGTASSMQGQNNAQGKKEN